MIGRRDLLKNASVLLAAASLPSLAVGLPENSGGDGLWERDRFIWLRRRETGEEIKINFYTDNKYNENAYQQFCDLMRDIRAGIEYQMDPNLMNALYAVQSNLFGMGIIKPMLVTSGYRSPQTNASIEGAAKGSLHMKGKAVDFVLESTDPIFVGKIAYLFKQGGVGFYPGRSFTHIDTGNFRTWYH
jgi:uncharacterized protein YcbK (DUF882 family)